MNQPFINFENVTFSYKKEPVLKKVNFFIEKGDYFAILGPNGSGKTTLLKIMLGVLLPDKGKVFLKGVSTKKIKDFSFIGYVPQHAAQAKFQFPVSAKEIVVSGRISRLNLFAGLTEKDKAAVDKAIRITGIESYQEKKMDELSGGQRQKVFIARALAGEPSILALDEPFSGVDAPSKTDFYNLLQKFNQELKVTVFLTSHDIDEVLKEAKNILFLNQSVVYQGPSKGFDRTTVQEFVHRHIVHD